MLHNRSMMPVLGGWVVWVHLLSLLVIRPPEPPAAPLRPLVSFVDFDETYDCDSELGPNQLVRLEAELSEPFDRDIVIPVKAIPGSAKSTIDFLADPDAAVVFKAGQTRGRIRSRDGLADVTIQGADSGGEPVQFRLELQGTNDVVTAADPRGYRSVRIPRMREERSPSPSKLTSADFTERLATVLERELPDQVFTVRAEMPAPKDTDLHFALWRGVGERAARIAEFSTILRQGATDASIRLADKLSPADLKRLGLADDSVPGLDEYYELRLDARPPLIAKDPGCISVVAKDDDQRVTVSQILEDERGNRVRRIEPGKPYWVVPVLSGTLETPCHVQPVIDGKSIPPGGVIPPGKIRDPRFGPFTAKDDRESLPIEVTAAPQRLPACGKCGSGGESCALCKPSSTACRSCSGRPGGCSACNHGAGACASCFGRPGGCLACGFGRHVCGACSGRPGGCGACGGQADGACVASAESQSVPVGSPVPGDFLMLLVNSQRLHEPGAGITEQTMTAIEGEKAYKDAVLLVDEVGERELKAGGPPPEAANTFRPFREEGDNLAGQAEKIASTVARKRDTAENPDLRAIVIWPERELSSSSDLSALKTLARPENGPISILCPDADPTVARRIAAELAPTSGGKGRVTVRCPKTPELKHHIRDIIDSGKAP